ncbi:MAG: BON domain-containing protein, partial [Gammaproteobacteria bacterium]|nr:BON domain-containing protein [Gammaproteobacteria bacterium]
GVTSFNRKVLLTGEAPTVQGIRQIAKLAEQIDGIQSVLNEIQVATPLSLSAVGSDAIITGKVKASIIDTKDLSSHAFKVVTDKHTVYLMGIVTSREADRVTEIAKGVGDVKKVVRVFDIISEDHLNRIQPPK